MATEVVLTIWKLQNLEEGWKESLECFDAVSPKIMDGKRWFRPSEVDQIFASIESAGCVKHGWGYHYCRDIAEARNEGMIAAKRCNALGVTTYWVNVEKHWAGTSDEPQTDSPPDAIAAFVESFREFSQCSLFFNGFAWKRTSKAAGSRPLCTEFVLDHFDGFSPMLYGTKARTIERKWRKRRSRLDNKEHIKWAPMIGTGRVDSRGNVWGFSKDQGDSPGIVSLNKEVPADSIAFFYGAGCAPMLLKGNEYNPSLIELSEQLRCKSG